MGSRVGVLREGKLCLCGEVNVDKLETTLIPQCIGRAVMGKDACTCLPWSAEQLARAGALAWTGDDARKLYDDVHKALRAHRETTTPPPVTRADCYGSVGNASLYFEYDRETSKWIAALSHAEVMGILAGRAT